MSIGVFTAINNSLNTCTVTNFNFTDQSGISHVANLTNFGGSASETANAVVSQVLPGGSGRTFSVYYNTSTIVGGTYVGQIQVLATMADLSAEEENVYNYLYIQTPPPVDPGPGYVIDYGGGGGGDGGGAGGAAGGGCDGGAAGGGGSCGAGSGGAAGGDGGGAGGGCFLTTAAVEYLRLPDDCRELTLVRKLRNHYMLDTNGQKILSAYDVVGPVIVSRVSDWDDFYKNVMLPVSELIEDEDYAKARAAYIYYTLVLLDQHLNYRDKTVVEQIFALKFDKLKYLPYYVKYNLIKVYIKFRIKLLKNDLR